MKEMVLANLKQRKTRSLVCVVAVGIGIALLLVLTGLCRGMIRETSERMKNTGAQILVQPRGAPGLIAFKGSSLPLKYEKVLRGVPGVKSVCPVMTWTTTLEKVIYVIYGIDLKSYEEIGGTLHLVQGRPWRGSHELLLDTRIAKANGYAPGDRIRLLGSDFTVAGIFKSGVGARIYLPIQTMQGALHLDDMCSLFLVTTVSNKPQPVKDVVMEIESSFPALKASALDRYEELIVNELTGLNEFFGVITATALAISFLVILLTMYTTIVERTREIGILRSLGATRGRVIRLIVEESVLLCMFGVLVGLVITVLVRFWLGISHPLLTLEISGGWFLAAIVLGIGGGLLGALYPGIKAANIDPVEALMYE
jgi:putative ABC transport system permease protein